MRFRRGRLSEQVEDRRGQAIGGRSLGIGAILLALVAAYFGVDPRAVLGLLGDDGPASTAPPADDSRAQFVSMVLADTEDTWHALFLKAGLDYQDPHLVLYQGATHTGCGLGRAALGPFYCPLDRKVYIDLGFYDELKSRYGAPGDFAQAYVIAHEVGHHVQNLLGISEKVRTAQERTDPVSANRLSVLLELQADCLAGVWAHHADRARQVLEQGDLEEGLRAASALGDDRLQRQSQGYAVPESFTHGSSAERMRWFQRGIQGGDPNACDTFTQAG